MLELAIALGLIMIVSGGLMLSVRQNDSRDIAQATVQMQADLRYAQRRAIAEGRRVGILFNGRYTYQIIARNPPGHFPSFEHLGEPRHFANNAWFHFSMGGNEVYFLPRGTVNRATTIQLRIGSGSGRYQHNTTITVSGGRVYAEDPPFRLNRP